jgi:hypothetical protein
MPGDPDGYFEKIDAQRDEQAGTPGEPKRRGRPRKDAADEQANRDEAERKDARVMDGERGPLSPAQHDDDGWGETPVQMRNAPQDEQKQDEQK